MHFRQVFPALVLVFSSTSSFAYTSLSGVHGGGKETVVTGGFLFQDAEYETNEDFDVDGQILTLGFKKAINGQLAIGGGAGFMLDGELQPRGGSVDDGSGYKLFFDADYEFKRFSNNQIIGTFTLNHDSFSFESGTSNDLEFTMTEAKIGGLFLHRIQNLSLHGGIEIFIFSDGELELVNNVDAERANRLNLRIGGAFALDPSFDIRADLLLMSEQTFALGVDFRI